MGIAFVSFFYAYCYTYINFVLVWRYLKRFMFMFGQLQTISTSSYLTANNFPNIKRLVDCGAVIMHSNTFMFQLWKQSCFEVCPAIVATKRCNDVLLGNRSFDNKQNCTFKTLCMVFAPVKKEIRKSKQANKQNRSLSI
jgi:hypothetical protein